MRYCQFRLRMPEGANWAVRGQFDEEQCCGKPATNFYTSSKGFDYYMCSDHFDIVNGAMERHKFAGDENPVDFSPCGSEDN